MLYILKLHERPLVPGPTYFLLQHIEENHSFFFIYINKNTEHPGFHRELHCTFLLAFFHLFVRAQPCVLFCFDLSCYLFSQHVSGPWIGTAKRRSFKVYELSPVNKQQKINEL